MPISFGNYATSRKKWLCLWVVAIFCNVTCWTCIALPSSHHGLWPLAVVLSVIYSGWLYLLLYRYRNELEAALEDPQDTDGEATNEYGAPRLPEESSTETTQDASGNEQSHVDVLAQRKDSRSMPILVGVLYGLFMLSVGAPGFIIATNVFPCKLNPDGWLDPRNPEIRKRLPTWETDWSLLPPAVQEWNQSIENVEPWLAHLHSNQYAQIDHEDGNVTVYFIASRPDSNETSQLQVVSGGSSPEEINGFDGPSWLAAVDSTHVCLRAKNNSDEKDYAQYSIHCGNEAMGFKSTERFKKAIEPVYLVGIDGLLWFRQSYANGMLRKGIEFANGFAVVSIDPTDMNITIHSTLTPAENPDAGFCGDGDDALLVLSHTGGLCAFLLSAMPVIFISGYLWRKDAVPPSALVLYFSIGGAIGCLLALGGAEMFGLGLGLWLFTSPIALFVCSYVVAVSKRVARPPLHWFVCGISTFLVFSEVSAWIRSDFFDDFYWSNLRWNPASVFPLLILDLLFISIPIMCFHGIIVGSDYLVFLGGFGVLFQITNATNAFVWIKTKSVALDVFLIAVECGAISAGTYHVYNAKDRMQKVLVDGLRQWTKSVCGTFRTETEMELADSLLLTEETSDGVSSDASDRQII